MFICLNVYKMEVELEVDFIDFSSESSLVTVKAGTYNYGERIVLLKFNFSSSEISDYDFGEFSKEVDYKNAKLNIGDDEYIKYDFSKSSVIFKLTNMSVTLSQNFAPKCLRYKLSKMFANVTVTDNLTL